jgi:hypothetical protein
VPVTRKIRFELVFIPVLDGEAVVPSVVVAVVLFVATGIVPELCVPVPLKLVGHADIELKLFV